VKVPYTDVQLDALRELANIGSGNAATALSSMLGRQVDVSIPDVVALPLADAVEAAGEPDTPAAGVAVEVFGDVEAIVLLLFPRADADLLSELLGVEPGSEIAVSALAEIGNILSSSYVGAFSAMTGLALEPRPPQTAIDTFAAIVSSVLATTAEPPDLALMLDSHLVVEGARCSFSFMLVPTPGAVAQLLARLGLGS
jgi:chemotaxis protein CheC